MYKVLCFQAGGNFHSYILLRTCENDGMQSKASKNQAQHAHVTTILQRTCLALISVKCLWEIWTVTVHLYKKAGWVCTQAAILTQRKVQYRCPPWDLWEPAAWEQHTPLPYATIIILAKTDSKDTAGKVETATKITSEDASSEQLST